MATPTLPGGNVRGYYHQLGVELPEHASVEAAVRCFADPAAHRREDRDPSCSINVVTGAWQCHGCGARGGAYDAALAKDYSTRAAIDLMVAHGLIERRARLRTAAQLLREPGRTAITLTRTHARASGLGPTLPLVEDDVARWQTALSRRACLLVSLARERGWRYDVMRQLQLGLDRNRITIPIRNARGELHGLLRYQPEHTNRPKMLAVAGSRLGLIPHPAGDSSHQIVLTEGPPDMIAARSRGLAAIAVPGAHAWRPAWAPLLAGRQVTIVMDADAQGRQAAERIAADLAAHADAQIVELAPLREDGYDLTDWLLEHPELPETEAFRLTRGWFKTGPKQR